MRSFVLCYIAKRYLKPTEGYSTLREILETRIFRDNGEVATTTMRPGFTFSCTISDRHVLGTVTCRLSLCHRSHVAGWSRGTFTVRHLRTGRVYFQPQRWRWADGTLFTAHDGIHRSLETNIKSCGFITTLWSSDQIRDAPIIGR